MDRSALEFNDELLSTNAFECSECGDILHAPTGIEPNGDITCRFCLDGKSDFFGGTFYYNSVFDALLEKIQFPCPFQMKGCKERFKYDEIRTHRMSCRFRRMDCIFSPLCKWKGQIEECVPHLKDSHEENLLKPQDNKFVIKNQQSVIDDSVRILSLEKATFIFHQVIDRLNHRIWCKIYDLENKGSEYRISLKHTCQSKRSLQSLCTVTQTIEATKFDESEATEVDTTILDNIMKPGGTWDTIIKIKPRETNDTLRYSILYHLECPVCKKFMTAPIYQCISGHSLCGVCKPRLANCPTCRANFDSTRNYSLESLTDRLCYPCIYHYQGCHEIVLAADRLSHELSCTFRPYSCFFEGCLFEDTFNVLMEHLQKMHEEKVFLGDTHEFAFSMKKYVSLKRYALLFDDKIFQVNYKRSLDYTYWAVYVDCPESAREDCRYVYEVCLVDTKRPDKKIICTDACLQRVNDEDTFEECLLLPNNTLMSFSIENMLLFHIKLRKKIATGNQTPLCKMQQLSNFEAYMLSNKRRDCIIF